MYKTIFEKIPAIIRPFAGMYVQRNIRNSLYGQGLGATLSLVLSLFFFLLTSFFASTGRHSRQELLKMGEEALKNLSTFLANKPFFLGTVPTTIDCSLYGMTVEPL
jgi:Na+/melibiose symporter-like transporter